MTFNSCAETHIKHVTAPLQPFIDRAFANRLDQPTTLDRRIYPFPDHAHFQDKPVLAQRETARQLGVSNGKVSYLMAALGDEGFLASSSFACNDGKAGKPGCLLTPERIENRTGLTKAYLAREESEHEALRAEIKAIRAEELRWSDELVTETVYERSS